MSGISGAASATQSRPPLYHWYSKSSPLAVLHGHRQESPADRDINVTADVRLRPLDGLWHAIDQFHPVLLPLGRPT